jgi:DNA-binding transcriptional ArsR family regulator
MKGDYKDLENVFKALAYEKRLKILDYVIRNESKTVSEISDALRVPVVTTSRNLGLLADAGLIKSKRRHSEILYSVKKTGILAFRATLIAMVKHAGDIEIENRRGARKPGKYGPGVLEETSRLSKTLRELS